ncbi:MAG: late competence development ComFB family protein [Gammaproteobacteria bacterium]|nr:late competence development ComFB family protein [Gammaproteobacteria bacterium]MDH5593412.1 late competence development ComFB family protein [Gammaproteobacteria bacterium]MDH5614082.1 late competence development ComFB family protein [Gammaproteobacteria bacterium]
MAFESLHNYYETLVAEHLRDNYDQLSSDQELIEDIACVALNQLPARYIRHDVDFIFYMSSDERDKMEKQVQKAVKDAVEFVQKTKNKKKSP